MTGSRRSERKSEASSAQSARPVSLDKVNHQLLKYKILRDRPVFNLNRETKNIFNSLNEKNWLASLFSLSETFVYLAKLSITCYLLLFRETNPLKKRARIHSWILNLYFGWVVAWLILMNPFFSSEWWLVENVADFMQEMMNFLASTISWLIGVPAGLKLNRPMTDFLGRFFTYHIYLWNSSLDVFKLILPIMVNMVVYSGFGGMSLMISVFIDVFSVLTTHNYCFYTYALRIYKLEVESLKSLFRLFRGKKLNPLRSRIDSYSYDTDQLFIGTLGFCIAFFLLPTIILYYVVFLSFRIVTVLIVVLLKNLRILASSVPIYETFLYLTRSQAICDQPRILVQENEDGSAKFSVQYISKSLSEILEETESESGTPDFEDLKSFMSNILSGQRI